MLNLICGEKGCGKTQTLHRQMLEAAERGKRVLLIVPQHFSFESEKRLLTLGGAMTASKIQVLSFARLAKAVLTTCRGINKPMLTPGMSQVYMSLALERLDGRLEVYQRQSHSADFIKKAAEQAAGFMAEQISPADLRLAASAVDTPSLSKKLSEFALIFETYDALVAQRFFDDGRLLDFVAEVIDEFSFFKDTVVFIDNFYSFTGGELSVIERALRQAESVTVGLCSTDVFSNDLTSPFAAVNAAARRLISRARRSGCEVEAPVYLPYSESQDPAVRAAALGLYDLSAQGIEHGGASVTVTACPSAGEECDYIAMRIKNLLRSGEYRCRDIAVICPDGSDYEKKLHASFKKYGIPFFEDRRSDITCVPLTVLVRALLSLCSEPLSTNGLMRYLKTGLSELTLEEISDLENYAIMWQLDGEGWLNDFTANPDGFAVSLNESRLERLGRLNDIRKRAVQPVLSLKERLEAASGSQAARAVYEFLREHHIDERLKQYALTLEANGEIELALEQQQVWQAVMTVLDEIAVILGDTTVGTKRLCEIFTMLIGSKALGKLPDGFDEVLITEPARAQTQSLPVVFMAGLSFEVFSGADSGRGIFRGAQEAELSKVLENYSCTSEQQVLFERFLAYASVASAQKQLHLSYPLFSLLGEGLPESPLVGRVLKLLPGCVRQSFSSFEDADFAQSKESAFELMAKDGTDEGLKAALKKYFSQNAEYAPRLAALERARKKTRLKISDRQAACELVGEKITLSASRLEAYESCPFKYFCKYELKIQPRRVARLDPLSAGSVVHYVLEQLLKKHSPGQLALLDEGELFSMIERLLDDYMNEKMGGRQDKTKRFIYLYERMKKVLYAVVLRLIDEFSDSDFVPDGFELGVGLGDIDAYTVSLERGSVELVGYVDRVDKFEKDSKTYIRVVDYKTGGKEFLLSDVLQGLNMQMLLYLMSICENGKKRYSGTVVPGGVLYMPASLSAFNARRGDDRSQNISDMLTGGKMSGMILNDGTVITAMDKSLRGRYIAVKMSKKTGEPTGALISLEQLGRLFRHMQKTLKQMGDCLHAGEIGALPAYGAGCDKTCEWCDYASVCLRERGEPTRRIERLNHEQCLEILDKGEENEQNLDA